MNRTKANYVGKAWMDAAKADYQNVMYAALGEGKYQDTAAGYKESTISNAPWR